MSLKLKFDTLLHICRSYDRSRDSGMGGYSYTRDSGMAVRGDNYGDSYNRDNRTSGNYDGNRSGSGFDGNRSATSGYDTQRGGVGGGYDSGRSSYDGYRTSERPVQSGDNYRSERQMQSSGSYGESARYEIKMVMKVMFLYKNMKPASSFACRLFAVPCFFLVPTNLSVVLIR